MGITKLIKSIGRKTLKQTNRAAVKSCGGYAVLDHPQPGEKITAPRYTFRIGTFGDIALVEISINAGPWQACRHSVGYWWYDWADYVPGLYQAAVRARTKDGQLLSGEPCKFQVPSVVAVKQPKTPKK